MSGNDSKLLDLEEVPAARIGARAHAGAAPQDLPNPATGEHLARVGWADEKLAVRAVDEAARARPGWEAVAPADRAEALRSIGAELLDTQESLAALITAESGKRLVEARGEVAFSARYFEWFAEALMKDESTRLEEPGRRYWVHRRPVGVVAAVSPWNFPLSIPARKIAAALAAGCPVVHKASELTPLTSVALTQLAEKHLPPGVVANVVGDGRILTTALVDHPDTAAVTFTGSTAVGAHVAARAMTSMTRVTMELGGKAPFIICADADPDVALEALMVAKFRNNGASCIAANNVFIHRAHYDGMLAVLKERVRSLVLGDPTDAATEIGPLLRPDHVVRAEALTAEAEAAGCAVTRSDPWSGPGWYATPALVEATVDCALWREEIFGPVLAVRPFDDVDALVAEVTNWRTGLGGYVMTSDEVAGMALAARLPVGIVGINNGAPNTPKVPFGGVGHAGLGREGGLSGLGEFAEEQTIAVAT